MPPLNISPLKQVLGRIEGLLLLVARGFAKTLTVQFPTGVTPTV